MMLTPMDMFDSGGSSDAKLHMLALLEYSQSHILMALHVFCQVKSRTTVPGFASMVTMHRVRLDCVLTSASEQCK